MSDGDASTSSGATLVPIENDTTATKTATHHTPLDLVELATQIQEANQFVRATATNKLQVVLEQMRSLQQQARTILEDATKDKQLHEVPCNFVKRPGKTYHLYKKESGQLFFSMLSPGEWGQLLKHEYCGSYYLGLDHSWTPTTKLEQRNNDLTAIEGLLNGTKDITKQLEHIK
ncbi:uncharacterized protein C1orf50-like [Dysidea avara]|uniref:uncharacterized protein C1orf50-like n=1 Tax=Dysidea avara TaxID=196820 RepID=UPI00332034D9